jgi:hypothetical protein
MAELAAAPARTLHGWKAHQEAVIGLSTIHAASSNRLGSNACPGVGVCPGQKPFHHGATKKRAEQVWVSPLLSAISRQAPDPAGRALDLAVYPRGVHSGQKRKSSLNNFEEWQGISVQWEALEGSLVSLWRHPEARGLREQLRGIGTDDGEIDSEAFRSEARLRRE